MERQVQDKQRRQDHFDSIDPEVREKLLQVRMELTVQSSHYKEQLRVAERQLQQWAIELMQLQETKQIAIENEDYMMAKNARAKFD